VVLVLSQYASTQLLTPKSVTEDPAQAQSQAILKFLPLMIGWFSLNVPSGLGLYWLVNNVVTTTTTVLIRQSVGTPEMATSGGGVSAAAIDPPKAQGFGRRYGEIVQTTDASTGTKVTIKPPGAATVETTAVAAEPSVATMTVDGGVAPAAAAPEPRPKKARKKKGGKKKK